MVILPAAVNFSALLMKLLNTWVILRWSVYSSKPGNGVTAVSYTHLCVEWMALGAYFHVKFRFGRTCYECVSAVAGYCCLVISRMDSFFHDFTSSIYCVPLLLFRSHPLAFRPIGLELERNLYGQCYFACRRFEQLCQRQPFWLLPDVYKRQIMNCCCSSSMTFWICRR